MKKKWTRILCLILAAVLLAGMMPSAYAVSGNTPEGCTEDTTAPTEPEPSDDAEPVEEGTVTSESEPSSETTEPSDETVPVEESELIRETIPVEEEKPEPGFMDIPMDEIMPIDLAAPLGAGENMHKTSAALYGAQTIKVNFKWNDTDSSYSTANIGGINMHYIGAEEVIAYCIDPATGSTSNTTYIATDDSETTVWGKLPATKRAAVALAILYGAPNKLNSTNWDKEFGYECATQLLIWEFIMGLRSPVAPYDYVASVDVTGGTGKADALYKNLIYKSAGLTSAQVQRIDSFMEAYAAIVASMKSHRTVPSFATTKASTAKTYQMVYDAASGKYLLSLTDTNAVLSEYNFTGGSVAVSRSGNTLNLSAEYAAIQNGVTMSAQGKSLNPDENVCIVWECANRQTLMTTTCNPDPVKAYFKLEAGEIPGTASLKKTAPDGNVEGFQFRLWCAKGNKTWCGISDEAGSIYQTNAKFEEPSTRNYTFSGLVDSEYSFREIISASGKTNVFPEWIRMTVTNAAGETTYDHVFQGEELVNDNGDCTLSRFALTGLTGGGQLTIGIHNVPVSGFCRIVKECEDGNVAGWKFRIEDAIREIGVFETDEDGVILRELPPGTYTVTELLEPDSPYECTFGNPRTVEIVSGETAVVRFQNVLKPGYLTLSKTVTDGSSPAGYMAFISVLRPSPWGSPDLGPAIALEEFRLGTKDESGIFYLADDDGTLTDTWQIEAYDRDMMELTELLRDADAAHQIYRPKELRFTLTRYDGTPGVIRWHGQTYTGSAVISADALTQSEDKGDNLFDYSLDGLQFEGLSGGGKLEIEIVNEPQSGEIAIHKVNHLGQSLPGVSFLLEWLDESTGQWNPVQFSEDGTVAEGFCTSEGLADGILVTDSEGYASFTGLHPGLTYRLTEAGTLDGYNLLTSPAFEGTLPQEENLVVTLTVVNTPSYELPATGGFGLLTVPIGTFGLLMCAAFLILRKKAPL